VTDGRFYGCNTKRFDPLQCDRELPLGRTFYPAGFPLMLATNSEGVMDCARESWGEWNGDFDVRPLRISVVVDPGGAIAEAPAFRKHSHLLLFVSDSRNFASADTVTGEAAIYVTQATVADHTLFRWLFLDALAYMMLTNLYVVSLHAACVARDGEGLLLCGKSGAGKSTLAVAAARAGFTFLSDDCTWVRTGIDELFAIGKPHQVRLRGDAARHFPELAGFPARTLPNGKLSLEAPVSLLAGVRSARHARITKLVFLQREDGVPPAISSVNSEDAATMLLADLPSYGPEVNAAHERTVAQLAALPARRLAYSLLDDAIRLLREI